jgi:hypothetical protein
MTTTRDIAIKLIQTFQRRRPCKEGGWECLLSIKAPEIEGRYRLSPACVTSVKSTSSQGVRTHEKVHKSLGTCRKVLERVTFDHNVPRCVRTGHKVSKRLQMCRNALKGFPMVLNAPQRALICANVSGHTLTYRNVLERALTYRTVSEQTWTCRRLSERVRASQIVSESVRFAMTLSC